MQRPVIVAPILASLMLLAGCGSGGDAPDGQSSGIASEPAAAAPAPSAPAALAKLPSGRSEKVSNDLFEFEYAYPAKVAAIPGLKALLDTKLESARAELETSSKADKAEAAKNDYPYRAHSSSATWAVVADLPRWLSLSAELYDYSGGAHGMTFFSALVWDKQANRALKPIELFSAKALSTAMRKPFCDALDKEREKRRGEPVSRDNGDDFNACIDPVESTLILGSSNGRSFDRIGVLIEPYAAGAYAEGTFDLTLPVTAEVIAAAKPEYREAFSVGQ